MNKQEILSKIEIKANHYMVSLKEDFFPKKENDNFKAKPERVYEAGIVEKKGFIPEEKDIASFGETIVFNKNVAEKMEVPSLGEFLLIHIDFVQYKIN